MQAGEDKKIQSADVSCDSDVMDEGDGDGSETDVEDSIESKRDSNCSVNGERQSEITTTTTCCVPNDAPVFMSWRCKLVTVSITSVFLLYLAFISAIT